jgi:hypothetical protein
MSRCLVQLPSGIGTDLEGSFEVTSGKSLELSPASLLAAWGSRITAESASSTSGILSASMFVEELFAVETTGTGGGVGDGRLQPMMIKQVASINGNMRLNDRRSSSPFGFNRAE